MEIGDAILLKREVEIKIEDMLFEFEKKTGLKVGVIFADRSTAKEVGKPDRLIGYDVKVTVCL